MIAQKCFYKKTRTNGIRKVVREHYLRDDISCSINSCSSCRNHDGVPVLDAAALEAKIKEGARKEGHFLVIDTNVVLHQMDVLSDEYFLDVIVPQTVFEEIKHRSPPAYKKLLDIINNPERMFLLFPNEFHMDTYLERDPGESINDRNDRAIRFVVKWFSNHIRSGLAKPYDKMDVILLTDDADNKKRAIDDGIKSLTTEEYVYALDEEHAHLRDKLASTSGDAGDKRIPSGKICFPEHRSLSEINSGLRSGKYKQGSIQMNRDNYLEGNVFVEGQEQGIFIQGLMNLNRAVQSDIVAIEMLPEEEWSAPAAMLKIIDMEKQEDKGDEIEESEDVELKKTVPKSGVASVRLPSAKVIGIIKRNWRPYCGMLQRSPVKGSKRHLFVPAERRAPKIRIETRQSDILEGQRIIVSIDSWPRHSRYPLGHFVRALGDVGDRATENEVLLLEHDVAHHGFSKAVLDCLPQMPWVITDHDREVRDDLRHLNICSVDPPGCTDIDDALHCFELPDGNIEAGVHIADVSHFVRPGNAMDMEAASRGTTVYLVDQRIDMLPELLSSNLCSLLGGVERFAFSCIWKLTPDADIIDVRFCKSIIRSRHALTYAEAQCRIDDKSQNDDVTKSLRWLLALSKKLKDKRKSSGALTLSSLEIRFKIDSETHDPIDVQTKKSLETTSMVEEFMLLANISVAKRTYEEFPDCALLRRHPIPPPSNYEPIIKAAGLRGFKITIDSGKALSESLDVCVIKDNPYFNTMLRVLCTRCMTQAVYFASGTVEQALFLHFGLASPIYTHFTSPIRRYADLMVHRLLAAAIGADRTYADLLDKKKSSKVCQNLNYRHKMAQYAGRASVLLNTHLFFRDRVEILEGYITSVRKNAFQVLIPKYGLESAVFVGSKSPFSFDPDEATLKAGDVVLKMFDPVTVQIYVDTKDLQHQKLVLELVEPKIEGFSVVPKLDTADPDETGPPTKIPRLD